MTSNESNDAPVAHAPKDSADPQPVEPGTGLKNRRFFVIMVVLLTLLALHVRVRAVLDTEVEFPLRADAGQYFLYAYNLRHHGVYSYAPDAYKDPTAHIEPDAFRSPGYPLFLVPFIDGRFSDGLLVRILLVQAVLSSLVVSLICLLGARFLPTWAALSSGLLTALSPHLINANVYLLTEPLFSFLLVLTFWAIAAYSHTGRLPFLLVCGSVIGATSLVRPSLQYFPVLLVVFLAWHAGPKRRLQVSVLLVLGFTLAVAPWLVRNLHTLGQPGDDSLKIATLHHGMYPDFKYQNDDRSFGFPYRMDPNAAAIAESKASVLAEIRRRFATEPARHLHWYLLGKPVTFWSWDIVQGMGDSFVYKVFKSPYFGDPLFYYSHRLMRALHWPLIGLGLLGCLVVWLPAAGLGLNPPQLLLTRTLSLVLLYFTALHMVGAPFPRYSVPLRPLIYPMALLGLVLSARAAAHAFRGIRFQLELKRTASGES